MVRRWNVLNAGDASNSSVDKIGKFLVKEALSVTAKQKPMKILCNFLSCSFPEIKDFSGTIMFDHQYVHSSMIQIIWDNGLIMTWVLHYKLLYPASLEQKGCWMSQFYGYLNVIPNVHLSAASSLIDRPKHIIRHFISCPVFPTTLSVSISLLYV